MAGEEVVPRRPRCRRLGKAERKALETLGYLAVGATALSLGIWLAVTGAHHELGDSGATLPFGLFVVCFCAWLLAGKDVSKRAGLVGSDRPPPDAHSRGAPVVAAHATPLLPLLRDAVAHPAADGALDEASAVAAVSRAGLPAAEAAARNARDGMNALPRPRSRPLWYTVLDEVHEPQQKLLLALAALYTLVGEVDEGAMALGVIALMVLAEVVTEWRAKRAVASLATAAPVFARVVRDGAPATIPREGVAVGDVLLLRAGFEVPADARLLATNGQLEVAEAALTGEALPVPKAPSPPGGALPTDTPLGDRHCVVLRGTVVTRGRGTAVVTAVGPATELGRLHAATARARAKEKRTPLQALLRTLAGALTWVALGCSAVGAALGFSRPGWTWQSIVLTALSLGFATVPEELPILVSAVLAVGAAALARGGLFVKRLRAMEALAHVDTLLTDKTGTLTRNALALAGAVLPAAGGEGACGAASAPPSELAAAVAGGAPSPTDGGPRLRPLLGAWVGMAEGNGAAAAAADPFEAAVLEAMGQGGGLAAALLSAAPAPLSGVAGGETPVGPACSSAMVTAEAPFDQAAKMGARVVQLPAAGAATASPLADLPAALLGSDSSGGGHPPSQLLLLKGAPEAVLARCKGALGSRGPASLGDGAAGSTRAALLAAVDRVAAEGQRMVAYAAGTLPAGAGTDAARAAVAAAVDRSTAPPCDLVFLGVLCFHDPLRPEVPSAIAQAHAAGIAVAMVTGDHPLAAASVARAAGILPPAGVQRATEGTNGGATAGVLHCGAAAAASAAPSADSVAVSVASGELGGECSGGIDGDGPPAWCVAAAGGASPPAVYARAAPEHKLGLVAAMQAAGRTVMVTGDGVNDAPALAAADVGLAVAGATDVARDAASIVVVRADFTAYLACVSEGRRLHDNLAHALAFYLGAKAGLVALFVVGTAWAGFPLAPVQIIVLELFMDVGASLSFVAEPAEGGLMARPPVPRGARFFDAAMVSRIAAGAVSMAACVLMGMVWGLYGPEDEAPAASDDGMPLRARGMAFVCWLLGHLTLAYNQRTGWGAPALLTKPLGANPVFAGWALAVVGAALVVGLAPVQGVLQVPRLAPRDWGVAVGICVGGTFWMEAVKLARFVAARARGG